MSNHRLLTILGGRRAPYAQRVLAIRPSNLIAYWPLSDTTGTAADNAEGTAARDGTYVNPNLAAAAFGKGGVAPAFNGAADATGNYINIYSADLRTRLNFAEGTVAGWIKVADAGVWTDGAVRRAIHIIANQQVISIARLNVNNQLYFEQRASNISWSATPATAAGRTDWIHVAMTWTDMGDLGRIFIDGVQIGVQLANLGADNAADLTSTGVCIGAQSTVPAALWKGNLAHFALWDTPLVDEEIAALYAGAAASVPYDYLRIPVDAADVDPSGNIYVGRRNYLLKSTDGGETWSHIYTVPTTPTSIDRVFCDSRGYVYVSGALGSADWGLYRSIDAGANFALVLPMVANTWIWAMDEDASGDLYAGEYSTNGAGAMQIWKSTNDGETWVQKYVNDLGEASADHIHDLRVDPRNGYVYATLGDPTTDTLLRSVDAGANWTVVVTGGKQLLAMAFLGDYVYVGTDQGDNTNCIYRFTDDGSAAVTLEEVLDLPVGEDVALFGAGETATKVFFLGHSEGKDKDAKIYVFDGTTWTTPYTEPSTSACRGFKSVSRHNRSGTFYVGHDNGATAKRGIKFVP